MLVGATTKVMSALPLITGCPGLHLLEADHGYCAMCALIRFAVPNHKAPTSQGDTVFVALSGAWERVK
jgi:hypothetical protein